MTMNDIIGHYKFIYVNSDNQRVNATAEIALNGSALNLIVKTQLLGGNMTLTFPVEFDQASGSLAIQAGMPIYNQQLTLHTSSGQAVQGYVISAFEFGDGYLSYRNTVYGLMPFGHDDTNGTYAQMGNMKFPQNIGDYAVEGLVIYFAKVQNPTSKDETIGMIDEWKNCTLIKTTAASPAKANFLMPVAAKPAKSASNLKSLKGYFTK